MSEKNKKKKSKKYKFLTLITLGLLICSSIWSIWWNVDNYYQNVYPFNKTMANFDRATTTTDLEDAADYCEKVYDYIEQFSGNPNWVYWAKTDRTNWNLIKKDLKSVIDDAREAANNSDPGDDAYQEAIDVLAEKIDGTENSRGLNSQINDNFELELYKRTWQIVWIGIALWSILFTLMLIFLARYSHYKDEEYYNSRY